MTTKHTQANVKWLVSTCAKCDYWEEKTNRLKQVYHKCRLSGIKTVSATSACSKFRPKRD